MNSTSRTRDGTRGSVSSIDFSERWIRDGLRVLESPGGIVGLDIDMRSSAALIARLKAEGRPTTYAPIIVCAAARALSRHSRLHVLTAGNKRLEGSGVDIGLSIAGPAAITPVVVIEAAEQKALSVVTTEIKEKIPGAQENSAQAVRLLKRWGWLLPFGFLRRIVMRGLFGQVWYRRQVSGTFQVSILPELDVVIPLAFNTAGVLGVGRIRERAVAVNGAIESRLTAPFSCVIDHSQWNGLNASEFLVELRQILENELESLLADARQAFEISI